MVNKFYYSSPVSLAKQKHKPWLLINRYRNWGTAAKGVPLFSFFFTFTNHFYIMNTTESPIKKLSIYIDG